MKTKLIVALTAFVLVFAACKKDDDDTDNGGGTTPEEDYQPTTAGSTWQYNSTSSGGTYTETAADTTATIFGEKYFVFNSNDGSTRYINKNGGVYKTYGYVEELNQSLNVTYLKDVAAGTTWQETQNFTYNSFTIPAVFKYTIASRDGEKAVNDTTYKNVIAVDLVVTANNPLTGATTTVATGQQFYAKGIGSILSTLHFDALGTVVSDSTYLISADIKK